MAGHRIPVDVRASIIEAVKAGQSCRGVARDHGVSHGVVSKIAREAQLSFERREQTAPATAAAKFDSKAARMQLVRDLQDDIEHLRARMRSPYTQVVSSATEIKFVHTDLPPIREAATALRAAISASQHMMRLEQHDGDNGSAYGRNMANDLMGALQLAYHEVIAEGAGPVDPLTGEQS